MNGIADNSIGTGAFQLIIEAIDARNNVEFASG
jgi:hypothetical protein